MSSLWSGTVVESWNKKEVEILIFLVPNKKNILPVQKIPDHNLSFWGQLYLVLCVHRLP